jgi:radical SAM superfamily enzyme YgiQ (UPF0313 family)
VFVGLETLSGKNLTSVDKFSHQVTEYKKAIRILHGHGIGVEAGLMFGFDGDRPEVFQKTLWTLEQLEVDAVQVSLFTPLPGTRFYASQTNRILDWHWGHYDFHHVVWQPSGMSVEALQAGHDWITREFYRPWRILRRIMRCLAEPCRWNILPFLVILNLAYLGRVWTWHIQGWNPARKLKEGHGGWLCAWGREVRGAVKQGF